MGPEREGEVGPDAEDVDLSGEIDDAEVGPPLSFPASRGGPQLQLLGEAGAWGTLGLLLGFWGLDLARLAQGRGFTGASLVLTGMLAALFLLPSAAAWRVGRRLARERGQGPVAGRTRFLLCGAVALAGMALALWQGLPGAP